MTFVSGSVLTAAQLNAHVRDNMLETAVAKATAAGGYFAATGPNALGERRVAQRYTGNSGTTSSSTFDDLDDGDDTGVTAVAASGAIVMAGCNILSQATSGVSACGVAMSGPSEVPASDARAVRVNSTGANSGITASQASWVAFAGSYRLALKYRTTTPSALFSVRRLIVAPF